MRTITLTNAQFEALYDSVSHIPDEIYEESKENDDPEAIENNQDLIDAVNVLASYVSKSEVKYVTNIKGNPPLNNNIINTNVSNS